MIPSFKRSASPLDSLFEVDGLFRKGIIFLLNTIILQDILSLFYGTLDIVELHVTLREVLLLACDAVHVVVAHGKGVRNCFYKVPVALARRYSGS